MTKETLKEIGKFLIDLAKIALGVAFLAPLVKDGIFSILPLIGASMSAISGFILINKGTKDD